MAERSGAREYGRHTGDLWNTGYQFITDQEFKVVFGPFAGFNKFPVAGQNRSTLFDLRDGLILNGTIGPAWASADRDIGKQILGMFELTVDAVRYQVQFRDDGTGDLDVVRIDSAASSTTNTSSIGHSNSEIYATAWGDRIYFVSEALTDLRFLDIATPTFGTISNSPDNGKFIFVLDNNVVIILKNASTKLWEAHWSVDADPTDWTSSGSGSNPFSPDLGECFGFGLVGDKAIVLFERGAVSIVPTGSLPVYRFPREAGIRGCGADRGVASDGTTLFYINRTFQLVAFRGGKEVIVGEGVLQWLNDTRVHFSLAAGAAVVLESSKGVYLVDADTLQYIARFNNTGVQLASDRPTTNNRGILDLQKKGDGTGVSLSLRYWEATGPDVPVLQTHDISFKQAVQIGRIELVFGDDYRGGEPPVIDLLYGLHKKEYVAEERTHSHIIYNGNVITDNFAVKVKYGTNPDFDDILREIIVYCRVTTDDDLEVMG